MAKAPAAPVPGKRIITWILIADGARARILANEGPGKGLAPALGREFAAPHPPTRALVTDRPGRAVESVGGSRHAMEPRVDWHRFGKSRFSRKMAAILDRAAKREAFDRVVLVAPPRALGDLRAALGPHAAGKVVGEINKDLTNVGMRDLPRHLRNVIAL